MAFFLLKTFLFFKMTLEAIMKFKYLTISILTLLICGCSFDEEVTSDSISSSIPQTSIISQSSNVSKTSLDSQKTSNSPISSGFDSQKSSTSEISISSSESSFIDSSLSPSTSNVTSSTEISSSSEHISSGVISTTQISSSITSIASSSSSTTIDNVPVTGVALNKNEVTLKVGESLQLNAIVSPSSATNKSIAWSSQDSSIAKVDNKGYVTAISQGKTNIKVKTNDGGYEASCLVTVNPAYKIEDMSHKTISSGPDNAKYDTNNGRFENNDIEYAYYRNAYSYDYGLGRFYAHASRISGSHDGSMHGAIYNLDPIPSLYFVGLTYKSLGSFTLKAGTSFEYEVSKAISSSSDDNEIIIDLGKACTYFMIETGEYDVYLDSITIYYSGKSISYSSDLLPLTNQRIQPTTHSEVLFEGDYVDVPIEVEIEDGKYKITKTKRYTYYSFEYLEDYHSSLSISLDDVAMTDPVDIANYYIAFKRIPPNFCYKYSLDHHDYVGSSYRVYNLFGSKTRVASEYNRTNGYAVGIPYNYDYDFHYLELDVDLTGSYTTSNRDVGRVVVWATGWSNYLSSTPVATFTRDHYETFEEYLGGGRFSTPFDTNNDISHRSQYYYYDTITLDKIS